jgi:phosphoglycerate dehydrogenase-like enzyme
VPIVPERAAAQGIALVSKEVLLARSDVLTIHLALSESTRGLIGAAEPALMKTTAYLVNTARGPIVDEAALVDAPGRRAIAGAAVDVFEHEPIAPNHPFLALDNIRLTPHIGYVTEETYRIYFPDVVENIRAFLDGAAVRLLNQPC